MKLSKEKKQFNKYGRIHDTSNFLFYTFVVSKVHRRRVRTHKHFFKYVYILASGQSLDEELKEKRKVAELEEKMKMRIKRYLHIFPY